MLFSLIRFYLSPFSLVSCDFLVLSRKVLVGAFGALKCFLCPHLIVLEFQALT